MEAYLGEIRMFAGNYAPQGWALCNGQSLSISEYDALFALIGTTYGGDGQTTFALPDLRGRIPVDMGTNPSTGTNYLLGQKGGVETVTLLSDQLPAHTHAARAQTASAVSNNPNGYVWAQGTGMLPYATNAPNQAMSAELIGPVGGSTPHENMMPYLTISFIICLYGTFPPQP